MADKNAGQKDSPMEAMWMSLTGASAHLHEEVPGIDAKSEHVGHEPDEFHAKTIVYVPIAVAVSLLVTYLVVSGIFAYVIGRGELPPDAVPFNERAARISSETPKPVNEAQPAVPQPRLEGTQRVDMARNGHVDPPYLRSFRPTADGNSPEIYPEFLRPENFVDPTSNRRALAEYAWVDHDKGVVQMPIEAAMGMLLKNKALQARPGAKPLAAGTLGKAKMSNGGVPVAAPAASKPADKHAGHDHDHDGHDHDHKKPDAPKH